MSPYEGLPLGTRLSCDHHICYGHVAAIGIPRALSHSEIVMRLRAILVSTLFMSSAVAADHATVWIGMAAPPHGETEGIYRATLDLGSGEIDQPTLAAEIKSPGFLALHPDGKKLYAVGALPSGEDGVAAFEISDDQRSLRLLNSEPIGDGDACHVAVDQTGHCLFTAQYGSGSIAAFPLGPDGRVMKRTALVRHAGSGPNKARQEAPHPHSVNVDPKNRYVLVPDLGTDRVEIYDIDLATGLLEPHGSGRTPAGSGPRHMKFHPNGRFAYVLNELELSVTAFEYDADKGTMRAIQTISTLPDELREVPNTASEIRIPPSGRFLYTANRGHDSIAVFEIDRQTGKLTFVELESVRGSNPRNFNVDPTGKWLLAAGLVSNTISVFQIDDMTGGLVYTGRTVNSPAPMCIEVQAQP